MISMTSKKQEKSMILFVGETEKFLGSWTWQEHTQWTVWNLQLSAYSYHKCVICVYDWAP